METFKIIDGYENYALSNFGNVRNNKTLKVVKGKNDKDGYKIIGLYKICFGNRKKITHRVNKLVALAFIPNPNNKALIYHIDNDRQNNNAHNLRWVTDKEYATNNECKKIVFLNTRTYNNDNNINTNIVRKKGFLNHTINHQNTDSWNHNFFQDDEIEEVNIYSLLENAEYLFLSIDNSTRTKNFLNNIPIWIKKIYINKLLDVDYVLENIDLKLPFNCQCKVIDFDDLFYELEDIDKNKIYFDYSLV